MKKIALKPFILSLITIWIVGIVAPSFAGPKGLDSGDMNDEYTFAEDLMDFLDTPQSVDEILIYNQHEELVISGSADNVIIKNYISRSDLLTEVDHVQYYRLSYDVPEKSDYRFASK
jgi:hypothetical protein